MLTELKAGAKVVGAKQTRRAIDSGTALRIFLAEDADPRITEAMEAHASEHGVAVATVPSMKELGHACDIAVGAAVAALVQP